jgi:hypothetical protein
MPTLRIISALGILGVVAILAAPSAVTLLGGPPVPMNERLARIVAFVLVAGSYAAALGALAFAFVRLIRHKSPAVAVAVTVVVAILGGILTPMAALPAVLGVRTFCFGTAACDSSLLQFLPHALRVGSDFPMNQVLPSILALMGVLTVLRRSQNAL